MRISYVGVYTSFRGTGLQLRDMATRKKAEHLKEHDFKSVGDNPLDKVPVSVRLPAHLAEYVRSQPNRNQWLIAAIAKQVEEEKQSQTAS